jgi:hypothetical protein
MVEIRGPGGLGIDKSRRFWLPGPKLEPSPERCRSQRLAAEPTCVKPAVDSLHCRNILERT